MRTSALASGLIYLLLAASAAAGQTRRDPPPKTKMDSARAARDRGFDSLHARNPAEVKRAQTEVRRNQQSAADSVRRRLPGDTTADPRTVSTTENAFPEIPPLWLDTVLLDTTRAAPNDTVGRAVEGIAPPGRTRAFLARLRENPDAPSFCRSGQGHPLGGREWCWERGFRLGEGWERGRAGDVTLLRPRGGSIDRAALADMVGSSLVEELDEVRTNLRLSDQLTGSWMESPAGGRILRIRAGDRMLAEVIDRNRDGRAESVWRSAPR